VFLSKLRLRKMVDGGQMVSSYPAIQQTSLIVSLYKREDCRPAKCQVAAAGCWRASVKNDPATARYRRPRTPFSRLFITDH
jgi:hypothetical protein